MPPQQKKLLKLEPKGDIQDLKKLFSKSKVVILVVFANWCGHCQTMKKNIWDPLCQKKDVSAENVAAVENSVLEGANEKEILANVEGYPTVLKIKNGRPVETIPLPSTVEEMKTLVDQAKQESESGEQEIKGENKRNIRNKESQGFLNMRNERAATLQEVNRNNSLTTLITPRSPTSEAPTSYIPESNPLERMEDEQKAMERQRMIGGGTLYDTLRQMSVGILPTNMVYPSLKLGGGGKKKKATKKAKVVKKVKKVKTRKSKKYR